MSKLFNQIWYQNHPLKFLLLPISWLFCLLIKIRFFLYLIGFLKVEKRDLPVIVIGNISIGGTGKTPLLIFLAKRLSQVGLKPAIVSRGYGRDNSIKCAKVTNKGSVLQQGDEPMLILTQTGSPVVIAKDRIKAIEYIERHCKADVILSDDGLQHYNMGRNRQWCVVDKQRAFGNGYCLPAGPLREPESRLKHFDCVLTQNPNSDFKEDEIAFSLDVSDAYQLNNPDNRKPLSAFKGAIAIAAIGNPKRFFEALKQQGFDGQTLAFDDHHQYTQADFEKIKNAMLLMTEKDAIKCTQINLANAWVVPVKLQASRALEHEVANLINDIQQKVL